MPISGLGSVTNAEVVSYEVIRAADAMCPRSLRKCLRDITFLPLKELKPVSTDWACSWNVPLYFKCWQAAIRQIPCKGRNLPNASAQIRWPWRPQGPKGEYIAAGDSHAAVLTTENLFLREGMSAFMKGASRLSCLLFTNHSNGLCQGRIETWK